MHTAVNIGMHTVINTGMHTLINTGMHTLINIGKDSLVYMHLQVCIVHTLVNSCIKTYALLF